MRVASLLIAAGALLPLPLAGKVPPADVIITHAKVYTVEAQSPWAESIAIRGDRIVSVGPRRKVERFRGPATRTIDAGGRLVMPGLEDSHVHFVSGSRSLSRLDLAPARSIDDIRRMVRAWVAAHPNQPWIQGYGWLYTTFPGGFPDRKLLDELIPDKPALMSASDGHSIWVNSAALAAAGIDRRTPDPANGTIRRDANGEATGVLQEAASQLVSVLVPKPTAEETLSAIREGLAEAARQGVVRMHSLGGDFEHLELFETLRAQGRLTARFSIAPRIEPPGISEKQWKELREARRQHHDAWIEVEGVKLMLDGVIDAYTGAMLQPYSDRPDTSGTLFWDRNQYISTVSALDREHFQVSTHAIGDAAIRLALDGYEAAEKANGIHEARHKVEHIEDIATADIPRFGKLGVVASFQPLHADPDPSWMGSWIPRVGPEREQRAWAWRSILRAHGRLAFGSDWPVVTINPWRGIQMAVTRQDAKGQPPGGWIPNQKLTLKQAVRAYTLGGAWAMHRDHEEGSIAPGKLADLVMLSQNIFAVDPHAIGKTKVLLTIVGGKIVYDGR
jgi:predicted amidohydrolase YtcJ